MAKISRYNGNLQAFGVNSTGNYRTVFGDVSQSDTLDDNVNADYFTGWEIIGVTDVPSKQDFNALGFTHGQLLAYLHQMGIAEYNASQEYHSDSVCTYDGVVYISLTDSNTGNTPDSNPSNWDPMISSTFIGSNYYSKTELDAGQLDNRYYTETELDAGQLDNRYYTETELDAGQLDSRYYTETELDAGQLDSRYYTETEIDTTLAGYIPTTQKGAINGVCPLDGTGLIDASYLPSYVDDVVEVATYSALPGTGETGKIYIITTDGDGHIDEVYRWSGSAYLQIGSNILQADDSLQLGSELPAYYTNASNLDAGTLPDARFPATLPAISGENLTNVDADTVGGYEAVELEKQPGINWTSRTSAADNIWLSVCYGNGLFAAVAYSGSGNRVMTSPDGINWTSRTSAVDNGWMSVCYGNGLFVAVSYSGSGNRVMTSPDGINWTSRTSAVDNNWRSVCYGNGLFAAVASSGSGNRVMTSPDGINWTSRTSATDNDWMSVCYGNGLFVAVASSGSGNRVMTSPDGINWTSRTSAVDNIWRSVCYGNGLFAAVAESGSGNRVMTSPDGINWTSRTSATDNDWMSVCYGNGLFAAVAESGTGNRVMTSPDGINWTSRTSAVDNIWRSVCYGNGLFVAVAYSGSGDRVMTSGMQDVNNVLIPDHIHTSIRGDIIYTAGNLTASVIDNLANYAKTDANGQTFTGQNTFDKLDSFYRQQSSPTAITATGTLSVSAAANKIITANISSGGTLTLDTAATFDSYFGSVANNYALEDISIINISTTAADDVTLAGGTGWTMVGNMVIEADDSDRANSSARFRLRKTGTAAWTCYRLS